MDAALRKHVHGSQLNLEEKKAAGSSDCDDHDGPSEETNLKVGNGKRGVGDDCQKDMSNREQGSNMPKMDVSSSDFNSKVSSSVQKKQDELLESAKAEMGQVMEENQRLRVYLEQIMKDYKALQMQFHDAVQETTKPSSTISSAQESDETEFVSLSLGRTSSSEIKKSEDSGKNPSKEIVDEMEEDKEGLALGLDCKFRCPKSQQNETSPNPSPETSVEELKEESMETWSSQKGVKATRAVDDEVPQQNPTKRARVSVRVRCDTPTMNDGCQWRKYGQKIAKGNPCPRAYYRCTVAPNCPVRKQVQRCADDMSILITTYEGTHNHPLPVSATAMASTTSAAACMLISGSTTAGTSSTASAPATLSSSPNLNGFNFYLSENSKLKPPFYIPNSSISSSPSYPTITLDLTTNSSAAAHINKMSNFPPRFSSTNLSFSSLDSTPLPASWTNGMLNYGNTNNNQTYNKNQISPLNYGRLPQETLYQSYLQKGILNSSTQQSLPPETIAAATKAITADPSFQSVLAAALTSIMGSGPNKSSGILGNQVEKSAQDLKLSENFPVLSSFSSDTNTTNTNGNKCASSFLNKSSNNSAPNSSQPGSLMFLSSSSMPFSSSNPKSTSPSDRRDHIS